MKKKKSKRGKKFEVCKTIKIDEMKLWKMLRINYCNFIEPQKIRMLGKFSKLDSQRNNDFIRSPEQNFFSIFRFWHVYPFFELKKN